MAARIRALQDAKSNLFGRVMSMVGQVMLLIPVLWGRVIWLDGGVGCPCLEMPAGQQRTQLAR
jgi:hypothetical protein